MEKAQANSFREGINKDLSYVSQQPDSLTDVVNGTITTGNGNEYTMQNDMGNTTIKYGEEEVQLSNGFVPIGMKEYGDILYIVSTDGEKFEIGSFPSPDYANDRKEEKFVNSGILEFDKSQELFGGDVIQNQDRFDNYVFKNLNPALISKDNFRSAFKYKIVDKYTGHDITKDFSKLDFMNNKLVIIRKSPVSQSAIRMPFGGIKVTYKNDNNSISSRPVSTKFIGQVKLDKQDVYGLQITSVKTDFGYYDILCQDLIYYKDGFKKLNLYITGTDGTLYAETDNDGKVLSPYGVCNKLTFDFNGDIAVFCTNESKKFVSPCTARVNPVISFQEEKIDDIHIAVVDTETNNNKIEVVDFHDAPVLTENQDWLLNTKPEHYVDGVLIDELRNYKNYTIKFCDVLVESNLILQCTLVKYTFIPPYSHRIPVPILKYYAKDVIYNGKLYKLFQIKTVTPLKNGLPHYQEDIWNKPFTVKYTLLFNNGDEKSYTYEYVFADEINQIYSKIKKRNFRQDKFGVHNSFCYTTDKEGKLSIVNLFSKLQDDFLDSNIKTGDNESPRDKALKFLFHDPTVDLYQKARNPEKTCIAVIQDSENNMTSEVYNVLHNMNNFKASFDRNNFLKLRHKLLRVIESVEAKPSIYTVNQIALVAANMSTNFASHERYTLLYFPSVQISVNDEIYKSEVQRFEAVIQDYQSDKLKYSVYLYGSTNKSLFQHVFSYPGKVKKYTNLNTENLGLINPRIRSMFSDEKYDWKTAIPYIYITKYTGENINLADSDSLNISNITNNITMFFNDKLGSKPMKPGDLFCVTGGIYRAELKLEHYVNSTKYYSLILGGFTKDVNNYAGEPDNLSLTPSTATVGGEISSYGDENSIVMKYNPSKDVKNIVFNSLSFDDTTPLNIAEAWYDQRDEAIPCNLAGLLLLKVYNEDNVNIIVPSSGKLLGVQQDKYKLCYAPIYDVANGYGVYQKITFNNLEYDKKYALLFYIGKDSLPKTVELYNAESFAISHFGEHKELYVDYKKISNLLKEIIPLNYDLEKEYVRTCICFKPNNKDNTNVTLLFHEVFNDQINIIHNPILVELTDDMFIYENKKEVGCWLLTGQAISNLQTKGFEKDIDKLDIEFLIAEDKNDFCTVDYLPLPFYEIASIKK